ncbi:MAG: ABC transporter ATP-binding protein [Cellvibrionales bacterium]|nr:ABC transporter ATP-binding protein [Cellvibrionales bacterium]
MLLDVNHLSVEFQESQGSIKAVRNISFSVDKGETLVILGESGCGKSVSMQAIMGLFHDQANINIKGSVKLHGHELLTLNEQKRHQIRGKQISMIFQDPMSSLNPTMKIGDQIAEVLITHKAYAKQEAWQEAILLLEKTRISDAHLRVNQYPFELSGGMLQRVMIAMSIACKPDILIADEPTTALDVSVQEQILDLLKTLQAEEAMSLILITHDFGVACQMADQVAVMYAGKIIEYGALDSVFYDTGHPYTKKLKASIPRLDHPQGKPLTVIEGSPPDLFNPPKGCAFTARCDFAMRICNKKHPQAYTLNSEKTSDSTHGSPSHCADCWIHDDDCPKPIKTAYRKIK